MINVIMGHFQDLVFVMIDRVVPYHVDLPTTDGLVSWSWNNVPRLIDLEIFYLFNHEFLPTRIMTSPKLYVINIYAKYHK